MILLKTIIYLFGLLLILIDVVLIMIIVYFIRKDRTITIEIEPDDYIEKAKEIIRKENNDD